jgi:ABC-type branched-subunit amino acid transport system substrate-binding protein
MKHGTRTGVLLAAALLAATTGCSTKASNSSTSSAGASGGSVKTGTGVNGTTITLGVLTDLTGVFAALGADITNAQTLFWEQQNAKGGVCGKYQVKLNVKDTGYVPQQGVQLYSGIKSDILAMAQTIGSPINTALEQTYDADKIVNIPSAWARNLTVPPGNAVTGSTYDVEMVNGLSYALTNGKIKEGDKIGHIYFEGEYGANGLAGSKYFASKHGMTIVEAKIKSTDTDMTSQITQFKAAGVKAIALTVAPAQLASAAGVAATQGLNVPIIGNNPIFSPALLAGPAGAAIKANVIVSSPVSTFDKNPGLLAAYKAKYPNGTPSLGVVFGTGASAVMKQVLDKACSDGDLTRDGVLKAKQSLTNVDTGGLVVPLDFSKSGTSPSTKNFILQPADVPGGAKALTDAVEAPEVAGLS